MYVSERKGGHIMTAEKRMGTRDHLTGVGDYQAFEHAFAEELGKGGNMSLAMVDIDRFKRVNDENGHEAGDDVLRKVARHLADGVSDKGSVFRYSGDQFAVVLPGTEKEYAFLLMERVRESFNTEHTVDNGKGGVKVDLSISVGIASRPDDGNDSKDIIRKAEGALHRAKTGGRGRICLSREEKMVTKTSHYAQGQLERLTALAAKEGVGEAVLLREGLDDLFKKYKEVRHEPEPLRRHGEVI